MTTLLLDLGNTRWKIARAQGDGIGPVTSGLRDDAGGLEVAVAAAGPMSRLLVGSVVDATGTSHVIERLEQVFKIDVERVRSTDPMPNMVQGYRRPEQLGVDRLLAMVAARAHSNRALCVIDAGTAVTVDFLDTAGRHLGGFILPGTRMFRECLFAKTAIPRDDRIDEHALLGRDTPTAVALGARYAVAGLVERFVCGSATLFPGEQVETVIGGGDADEFLGLLPKPCIKLNDLVLRGLAVLAAGGDR